MTTQSATTEPTQIQPSTLFGRAITNPISYWLWRLACLLRALVDGGGIHGCCTCGGTSSTWRYWGATDTYAGWPADWPQPPSDWAECDACHDAKPAGDWMLTLDHERDAAPVLFRVIAWLLIGTAAIGVLGAITGPSPVPAGAAIAAVLGLVLTVVAVLFAIADVVSRDHQPDTDQADQAAEVDEPGPDGAT